MESIPIVLRSIPLIAPALAAAMALTACSSGGGDLAPGLTQRMDQASATLDRTAALNIVNDFRATSGAPALQPDPALDARAQEMARAYADNNARPDKPADVDAMRLSSGYATFADTFSGWRNAQADAGTLADPAHARAGFGVAYSESSTYGVHWVLLLDGADRMAAAQ